MDAESTIEVVRGVRKLALRRGWKPVEDLAAKIMAAHPAEEVLLAGAPGVNTVPFGHWVRQLEPKCRVRMACIDQLGAPGYAACFAQRVFAVFECGRLLQGAGVNAVAKHLWPRPIESYALVFVSAERLECEEDLAITERAIWRVMVPHPLTDWCRQDLAKYRCFFWSEGEPCQFLRERRARDIRELADVVRSKVSEAGLEVLERALAARLLDLADEHMPAGKPGGASGACEARMAIAHTRRRIVRLLNQSAIELSRQAVVSLLRMEQELLVRLEQVLRSLEKVPVSEFSKALQARLEEEMAKHNGELEAELNERVEQVVAATEGLLRRIDWAPTERESGKPDFRIAGNGIRAAMAQAGRGVRLGHKEVRFQPQPGPIVADTAGILALGGLASVLTSRISCALISAGLAVLVSSQAQRQWSEQNSRHVRQEVRNMTERQIPQIRDSVQRALGGYRDDMIAILEAADGAVVKLDQEVRTQGELSANVADTEQLMDYRRRL